MASSAAPVGVVRSADSAAARLDGRAADRSHFMPGKIGIPELLIILTIVVLIFGASRLPEIGRGIGRGIRNFKDATREGAKEDRA
jgi:sec-independent protein translocase protein TatA